MNLFKKAQPYKKLYVFLNHALAACCVPLERILRTFENPTCPKPKTMNFRLKPAVVFTLLVVLGITFHNFTLPPQPGPAKPSPAPDLPTTMVLNTDRYGKVHNAQLHDDVFAQTDWKELGFPKFDEELEIALKNQLRVLENSKFKDGQKVGSLRVTYGQLKETIEILLQRVKEDPGALSQYLNAYQAWGGDKKGNTYFTGYFTPVMEVSSVPTKKYKYPIYAYPKELAEEGKLPTRAEIDGEGALKGMGLELAYASNPLDIYIMQLQGSGYVKFVDTGAQKLFRYAGENRHPYRNIQRFFRNRDDISIGNLSLSGINRYLNQFPEMIDSVLFFNPSYTFFTPSTGLVKGAGMVPLMEGISVAADDRYFPLGSVLLAAFPVIENGIVKRHEFKVLLPQDVGGAIRGAGHLDVYCGIGKEGQRKASSLHHYGQVWLLLPKDDTAVALNE